MACDGRLCFARADWLAAGNLLRRSAVAVDVTAAIGPSLQWLNCPFWLSAYCHKRGANCPLALAEVLIFYYRRSVDGIN